MQCRCQPLQPPSPLTLARWKAPSIRLGLHRELSRALQGHGGRLLTWAVRLGARCAWHILGGAVPSPALYAS